MQILNTKTMEPPPPPTKTLDELIKQEEEHYNSASLVTTIGFITDYKLPTESKQLLNSLVNRTDSMSRLLDGLKEIDTAILIEAGIYEFTLVYSSINSLTDPVTAAVYNDKLNELLYHLKNRSIRTRLRNNEIKPQLFAFMSPQEVEPENWTNIVKKQEFREYKKNNMATTDLYKCFRCSERRCQIRQLQTRGADEPITNFVTCMNCKHTFKV